MTKTRENQVALVEDRRERNANLLALLDERLLNLVLDLVLALSNQGVIDAKKIRSLKLSKELQSKIELYLNTKSELSEKSR